MVDTRRVSPVPSFTSVSKLRLRLASNPGLLKLPLRCVCSGACRPLRAAGSVFHDGDTPELFMPQ